MTDNGKTISDSGSGPISIQMETNIKEIGIMTFNGVWGHITTQTEIYTKANGKEGSPTAKATISIKVEKQYTRETGKMVKNRDLAS